MPTNAFEVLHFDFESAPRFRSQVEAHMAVFEFIEGWYNPRRRLVPIP